MPCYGCCFYDGKIEPAIENKCSEQSNIFNEKGNYWSFSPYEAFVMKLRELQEGKCTLTTHDDCVVLSYTHESDIELQVFTDGRIVLSTSSCA